MTDITLIFPHQLFKNNPSLVQSRRVYILEEHLFFRQYQFHKQKLLLHRASMKYYQDYLREKGYDVHYIEHFDELSSLECLFGKWAGDGVKNIHHANVTDYLLERRMRRYALRYGISLIETDSPGFLRTPDQNEAYFADNKFFLNDYYISLRKEYDLLIVNAKPQGGKWTYDTDNRKKMPAGTRIPGTLALPVNAFVPEAQRYIDLHFPYHYGSAEPFRYPVTHADAELWLDDFLERRFYDFGIYQDAMVQGAGQLFHSIITPMLNIGLLTPDIVIDRVIAAGVKYNVPLNSVEGYIRQVLGWREYMRAVYELKGVKQRTGNFWQHTRKIPESFWKGTTGIAPVDDVIRKLLDTGYAHHIERLMVLGNFMLLCEFDPDEVYRWFMELFIDSYDWVMVPNVYGMSQYADGGLMSTKPYISGSNYILKMSNYKRGTWCEVWDALYWRFIYEHREVFADNPRMSMMVRLQNNMDKNTLNAHLETARKFLDSL